MRERRREILACAAIIWIAATSAAQGRETPPKPAVTPKTEAIAVIVHPKNPTTALTMTELRAYFLMDRQFWSDHQRTVLYLRPSKSAEMKALLDLVYDKSGSALRKYWRERVFRGEIPAKPAVVPAAKVAIARVKQKRGAFTVILQKDVPKTGVRVLKIDGKLPTDSGYPLRTEPELSSSSSKARFPTSVEN